jgi:hypothetical protein
MSCCARRSVAISEPTLFVDISLGVSPCARHANDLMCTARFDAVGGVVISVFDRQDLHQTSSCPRHRHGQPVIRQFPGDRC